MPNMTEGLAIVIAAFISVAGMVFVQISNNHQRKIDSRERLFYEVYPKRLALYEEIINKLEAIIESEGTLMKARLLTKEVAMDRISKNTHLLNNLFTRIKMFGSVQITVIFFNLIIESNNALTELYKTDDHAGVIFGGWIETVWEKKEKFIQLIRKDSGANLVERTIKAYFADTMAERIQRIKDKLFPSELTRDIKKMDMLGEKYQNSLLREKKQPTSDKH